MTRRTDPLREIDRMFRAIDRALFGSVPRPARSRPSSPPVTSPVRAHSAADASPRKEDKK